jgi:hypothetical protein
MQNYDVNDFVAYYNRSWWICPLTGEIVRIAGIDPDNAQSVMVVSVDRPTIARRIALRDIDWKHVSTPPLGYRSAKDGHWLYYLTRKSGRRAAKGVTPEAIIINTPSIMMELMDATGQKKTVANGLGNDKGLLKSLFTPEFVSLSEALDSLKHESKALGFALDYYWAISLGLWKEKPFLLHFKNVPVGHSVDGETWVFSNTTAESLFNTYRSRA